MSPCPVQSQVGAWEAIAAVGAYFSLLEHELVLVSAFADVTPEGGALLSFIGARWSDKFRQVFDLGDATTNRVHQHLHEIAETYRNPYSHGGFPKQGASLWFHLEGIGAIPAGLSNIRSSPHFELFPVRVERFETICTELDATDNWLRNGRARTRPSTAARFRFLRIGRRILIPRSALAQLVKSGGYAGAEQGEEGSDRVRRPTTPTAAVHHAAWAAAQSAAARSAASSDPTKMRQVGTFYYVVISLISGFPALVSAAYGSPMAYAFGFLFVVFAGWPLLLRRRR